MDSPNLLIRLCFCFYLFCSFYFILFSLSIPFFVTSWSLVLRRNPNESCASVAIKESELSPSASERVKFVSRGTIFIAVSQNSPDFTRNYQTFSYYMRHVNHCQAQAISKQRIRQKDKLILFLLTI